MRMPEFADWQLRRKPIGKRAAVQPIGRSIPGKSYLNHLQFNLFAEPPGGAEQAAHEAVEGALAVFDYAQPIKLRGNEKDARTHERKCSPAECNGIRARRIEGSPKERDISIHMLSLYFVHNRFVRIRQMLRVTPAMEAGVSDTMHDMKWIVSLMDAAGQQTEPAQIL